MRIAKLFRSFIELIIVGNGKQISKIKLGLIWRTDTKSPPARWHSAKFIVFLRFAGFRLAVVGVRCRNVFNERQIGGKKNGNFFWFVVISAPAQMYFSTEVLFF